MCVAPGETPKGARGGGTCSETMMPRGCSNVVSGGVALGLICGD
jgi:hypothetical protein